MAPSTIPQSSDIIGELIFIASRSGGPGGQNVNKVNSKVTMKWDVANSQFLNEEQKSIILRKGSAKLSKEGIVMITARESRSQLQNKGAVLSKLDLFLTKIFTPTKKRKATKPTKAATHKRLDKKKHLSRKKELRQKPK